jgi:hypothetical protein
MIDYDNLVGEVEDLDLDSLPWADQPLRDEKHKINVRLAKRRSKKNITRRV